MSDKIYLIREKTLRDTADAIRERKDSDKAILGSELAEEVTSIRTANEVFRNQIEELVLRDTEYRRACFLDLTSLTKVTIEKSATQFGPNCFEGCDNLKTVLFNGTFDDWKNIIFAADATSCPLVNADEFSFLDDCGEYTSSLDTLELPATEGALNKGLYYINLLNFRKLVFPSSYHYFYKKPDFTGKNVEEIEIDDEMTQFTDGVFAKTGHLRRLKLPFIGLTQDSTPKYPLGYLFGREPFEGATKIPWMFFTDDDMGSVGSSTYYVPDSLEEIEVTGDRLHPSAFYNCVHLKNVIFSGSPTKLPSYTFFGCTGITHFDLPASVTEIEIRAFYGCTGLTELDLPDGLHNIGEKAFGKCSNLVRISIPDTVESIAADAFVDCDSLEFTSDDFGNYLGNDENPYLVFWSRNQVGIRFRSGCRIVVPQLVDVTSIAFDGDALPKGSFQDLVLVSLSIENLREIPAEAFKGSGLSGLIIRMSSATTRIGSKAFDDNGKTKNVYFDGSLEEWLNIEVEDQYASPLVGNAKNRLYINDTVLEGDVILPETVSVLQPGALRYQEITSIDVSRIVEVRKYALSNCALLTGLCFSRLERLCERGTATCKLLTRIDLGPAITEIEAYACSNDYSLRTVIIRNPNTVVSLASKNVFGTCYRLLGTVNETYNPEGLKGNIYVPDPLVEDYRTEWADLAELITPLSEYVEE